LLRGGFKVPARMAASRCHGAVDAAGCDGVGAIRAGKPPKRYIAAFAFLYDGLMNADIFAMASNGC
jgi:hypothetical protein